MLQRAQKKKPKSKNRSSASSNTTPENRGFFHGIHNHRTMDGGKNPQAKTEPKERNFWFSHFLARQDFSRKIGPDREKVEKISPTHPRRFALHCGPPYFGLGAGNRGAIRGFSSLFGASPEKLESRFPGISNFREDLDHRRFSSFSFRSGISRSEIEIFPNRGPRRGSIRFGWEPE